MKIDPIVAAIATAEAVKLHPSWSEPASSAVVNTAIRASTWTGSGHFRAAGDALGPDHEPEHQRGGHPAQGGHQRAGAVAHHPGRAQLQEGGAVEQAQAEHRHAGPQPVAGQQVAEVAGELVFVVDRQAGEQVAQADPEQQRYQHAAGRQRPPPAVASSARRRGGSCTRATPLWPSARRGSAAGRGTAPRTWSRTRPGRPRRCPRPRRSATPRCRPTRARSCSPPRRRSCSSRPTTMCSAPTPKSNPSSTKKPTHRTAMHDEPERVQVQQAVSPSRSWPRPPVPIPLRRRRPRRRVLCASSAASAPGPPPRARCR